MSDLSAPEDEGAVAGVTRSYQEVEQARAGVNQQDQANNSSLTKKHNYKI
jgi:hypothetical protein